MLEAPALRVRTAKPELRVVRCQAGAWQRGGSKTVPLNRRSCFFFCANQLSVHYEGRNTNRSVKFNKRKWFLHPRAKNLNLSDHERDFAVVKPLAVCLVNKRGRHFQYAG